MGLVKPFKSLQIRKCRMGRETSFPGSQMLLHMQEAMTVQTTSPSVGNANVGILSSTHNQTNCIRVIFQVIKEEIKYLSVSPVNYNDSNYNSTAVSLFSLLEPFSLWGKIMGSIYTDIYMNLL